jgi:gliding motility-associated-like protein
MQKKFHKVKIICVLVAFICFLSGYNSFSQCAGIDINTNSSGNCLPALVRFIATPDQPAGSVYYWDMGDGKGQILSGDTFFYQYTKPGSYGVNLTIVYKDGSKCVITKPNGFLTFTAATSLGFYADNTIICSLPAVVTLHDTTTNISHRDWYINGNLDSNHTADITTIFNSSGYQTITLVVTNYAGCIEVVEKKNYIYVPGVIKVSFCSVLKENATHDQITAYFKPDIDSASSINSITWDFPGGSPSSYSGADPPAITYTDLSAFHDVTLTVKTASGCVAIFKKQGLVGKYYSITKSNICQKEIADINYVAEDEFDKFARFGSVKSNLKINIRDKGSHYFVKFLEGGTADMFFEIIYKTKGCSDSLYVPGMFKILPPIADFSSTTNDQCNGPAKVTFHALYGNPVAGTNTYTWHLYDSAMNELSGSPLVTTIKTDTSYVFNNPGLYSVKLITSNSLGCNDTMLKINYVRIGQPDIKYTMKPDTLCVGDTLKITNLAKMQDEQDNPLIYRWDFQNTDSTFIHQIRAQRSPIVVFDFPGIYNLDYIIKNGNTCQNSIHVPKAVVVNGVAATIQLSGFNGCAPVTKKLSAIIRYSYPQSSSLSYSWDVEPASTAVLTSPNNATTNVVLSQNGCYSIKLTVSSSIGCQNVFKKDSLVCIGTKALFSINGTSCKGIPLPVVNESALNPDQFKWIITPMTGVTINSDTARNPKIIFSIPGCYKVLLKTSKSSVPNCYDTVSHQVCITTPPYISKVYSPDTSSHCAPRFDHFLISAPGAKSYFWSFGDTTTLITQDTASAHAYFKNNNAGYTIKAVAIDSNGCPSDTTVLKNYIKISGPEPAFKINSRPPCKGGIINFTNLSKYIYHFYFLYGDNSPVDSNSIDPHFYKFVDYTRDSNIYIPTLFTYDETGCLASASAIVKLYRPPVAAATTSDTEGCHPFTVHFIDSTKYADSILWNFGDGSTDTAFSPVHIFKLPSPPGRPYQVTMTANTKKGCTATINPIYITVHPTPLVHIAYKAPKVICYQDSIQFFGQSKVALSRYIWKFGDGNLTSDTSTLQNPVYHYQNPGPHKVSFIGFTQFGCGDSTIDSSLVTLDSIHPPQPVIDYVTVTPTNQVMIFYNKTPSPKFSFNTVYRFTPLTGFYSTTDLKDTVANDFPPQIDVNKKSYGYTIITTDFCGKESEPAKMHFTILLNISKSGNRDLKLAWNKYVGWDSVSGYEVYKLNNKKQFSLLAGLSASDTIYTDTSLCPALYTYYVAAIYKKRKYISSSNIVSDSPLYVYPTVPVVMRTATVVNNQSIEVRWDSVTQPNEKFYAIDRNAHGEGWQMNYRITSNRFIIDDNVDVNRYSYAYRVKVIDACGYTGSVSNIATSILLNSFILNDTRWLQWNDYKKWDFGVMAYYIQLQQKDGSFKDYAVNQLADTVFLDSLAHTELGVPTCYRVYAVENTLFPPARDTSLSNISCPNLPSRIFIPNSFSPNNDSINDVFKPVGLSILNEPPTSDLQYDFKIYNRWGQLIFETHDQNQGWNGTYKGKDSPVDVYVYIIEAHGLDGRRFFVRGNVTLIK